MILSCRWLRTGTASLRNHPPVLLCKENRTWLGEEDVLKVMRVVPANGSRLTLKLEMENLTSWRYRVQFMNFNWGREPEPLSFFSDPSAQYRGYCTLKADKGS